ncbi:hypothetical protein KY331_01500 [Candidatus Woesearchaeota archaeon]|nr:hypothetical protein [Candidatus Woesearchaeota archaeon]
MLNVDWKDIDAYERADLTEDCELVHLSGVVEKNFFPNEPIPSSVSELVQKLEEVLEKEFPNHSIVGVQTHQDPNPEDPDFRYVAYMDIEQEGNRIGGITCTCRSIKSYSGGEGKPTRTFNICDLSMILPIGDLGDASRKVIEAAWPYIGELHHTDKGDNRYIFKAKGREVLAAGHAVLKEMGAKLPEKPTYMLV